MLQSQISRSTQEVLLPSQCAYQWFTPQVCPGSLGIHSLWNGSHSQSKFRGLKILGMIFNGERKGWGQIHSSADPLCFWEKWGRGKCSPSTSFISRPENLVDGSARSKDSSQKVCRLTGGQALWDGGVLATAMSWLDSFHGGMQPKLDVSMALCENVHLFLRTCWHQSPLFLTWKHFLSFSCMLWFLLVMLCWPEKLEVQIWLPLAWL